MFVLSLRFPKSLYVVVKKTPPASGGVSRWTLGGYSGALRLRDTADLSGWRRTAAEAALLLMQKKSLCSNRGFSPRELGGVDLLCGAGRGAALTAHRAVIHA